MLKANQMRVGDNYGGLDLRYYLTLALGIRQEQVPSKIVNKDFEKWKKYRKVVWDITNKQNIKSLPNADRRGFKKYHLDHKVSIWYGFKNNIDPKLIGSIDNLEFIPYKENMLKSTKCNFKGAKNMQTVIFV